MIYSFWAIPACIDGTYTPQKEENKTVNKTIRKGNKGELVKKCQQLLVKHGYSLGICGVDGDFGTATEKAVKEFQKDNGLKVDGIVGESTWAALEKEQQYYRVTVSHVTKNVAEEIKKKYGGEISAE